MKNIILALATLVSFSASAHMIDGIQILKGSIKTKVMVNQVKTNCRVKVEKVKNLMQEDSFGNPAYKVLLNMQLDSGSIQRNGGINLTKDLWFNNLFQTMAGTEVRDLEYFSSEGSTLRIDREGRIKVISLLESGRTITCTF
jgi:hypothetical protein